MNIHKTFTWRPRHYMKSYKHSVQVLCGFILKCYDWEPQEPTKMLPSFFVSCDYIFANIPDYCKYLFKVVNENDRVISIDVVLVSLMLTCNIFPTREVGNNPPVPKFSLKIFYRKKTLFQNWSETNLEIILLGLSPKRLMLWK